MSLGKTTLMDIVGSAGFMKIKKIIIVLPLLVWLLQFSNACKAQTGCMVYGAPGSTGPLLYTSDTGTTTTTSTCTYGSGGTGPVPVYNATPVIAVGSCDTGFPFGIPSNLSSYVACSIPTLGYCGIIVTRTAVACPIDSEVWFLIVATILMSTVFFRKQLYAYSA